MVRGTGLLALLALGMLFPSAGAEARSGWFAGVVQAAKGKLTQLGEQRRTIRKLRAIDPLLVPAYEAAKQAHAPYSGLHMGAALTLKRGGPLGWVPGLRRRIVRGFNSESQGDLQICAERAAMAGLPRGEAKRNPVQKIAVVSDQLVPSPCGRCLQVLSEVGSPDTEIVAANLKGQYRRYRLSELLPTQFDLAPAAELKPHRQLILSATRAYRQSLQSGINRYRPAFGAVVKTDRGDTYLGMVIKDTASTFTPATQLPLDQLAQRNALSARSDRVQTVVIAGPGTGDSRIPVPTADERQHLFDMNPEATVVLYNPAEKVGSVLRARDLLPHAYRR
jgi:cytidine deaminase